MSTSTLVYTVETRGRVSESEHAARIRRIAQATATAAWRQALRVPMCAATSVEPHVRGEFPLDCRRCHEHADA